MDFLHIVRYTIDTSILMHFAGCSSEGHLRPGRSLQKLHVDHTHRVCGGKHVYTVVSFLRKPLSRIFCCSGKLGDRVGTILSISNLPLRKGSGSRLRQLTRRVLCLWSLIAGESSYPQLGFLLRAIQGQFPAVYYIYYIQGKQ